MNASIDTILAAIGESYKDAILKDGRHYLEVNLGRQAQALGITDIPDHMRAVDAIVPLKGPVRGMKVRIDGRTFVNYAQFESGVAIPGHVAREAGLPHTGFVPGDSMVLNFA
ncbi:MAG: hypothetical protein ACOZBW_06700 [Thermodesulfobacteriota bacterium]